jgi:hypothetical protein
VSGMIFNAIKCRCLHPRNLFAAIAANIYEFVILIKHIFSIMNL